MKTKTISLLLCVALFTIVLIGCAPAQTDNEPITDSEMLNDDAIAYVEKLSQGEYEKAINEHKYSLVMALVTNETMLETIWSSLTKSYGDFVAIYDVAGVPQTVGYSANVKVAFARKCINLKMSYNNTGKISGIHYSPNNDSSVNYGGAAIVLPQGIIETDVTFGSEEFPLSATLSYPENAEFPLKAVILVHGSGPNDRNETVSAQEPFKDIAWGLTQRGIAVLRYDKRTLTHGEKIDVETLTPYEETVEDALYAEVFLRTQSIISVDEVVILGHSLGGLLTPDIAKQATADKYVMMAAPVTSLHELIVYQYDYILSLDGKISFKDKLTIKDAKNAAKKINELNETSEIDSAKLHNASVKYWLYLNNYNIVEDAKLIDEPLLILQGEMDYQVPLEEFETLKEKLGYMDNVIFISYPNLSHLFSLAYQPPSPDDYNVDNDVDEKVIDDIAEFVLN